MNLPNERERGVCVCDCVCTCIHLLTGFLKHFRSSHGCPGNHREELPCPVLPNSGAPTFWGDGVACGQQHFLPRPFLCRLPLLHTVLLGGQFFKFYLALPWLEDSNKPQENLQGGRAYREKWGRGEETTSKKLLGHRLLVLGLNGFPVQKL